MDSPTHPQSHAPARRAVAARWLAALLLLGAGACGTDEASDKDAGGSDIVVPVFGHDATDGGADALADTADAVDATDDTDLETEDDAATDVADVPDTAPPEDVQSGTSAVKLTVPDNLPIGSDAEALVEIKGGDGQTSTLADGADVTVEIDGADHALGYDPVADAKGPPAAVVWRTGAGKLRIVGVRPGSATIRVTVEGVTSAASTVAVGYGAFSGIVARVPDAGGSTAAAQQIDVADKVKLGGATIGGGGLDAQIRFPQDASGGSSHEVGPGKPASAVAGFADLAGTKYTGAQGWVFVDQTNKGLFRGSVWVRTAQLKPVLMAFSVERDGLFGIDPLDEAPTELAKSDALEPLTGSHHSRVTVLPGAPGSGRVHVVWREIENVLKARLRRVDVTLVGGAVDTTKPPLLDDLNAYDSTPSVPAAAMGEVALVWNGGQGLLVWEGRDGKGATKPHALWAVLVDPDLVFKATPIALEADGCSGACRPRVAALQGGRFLVVWSRPSSGVKATRVKALLADGKMETAEETPVVVSTSGKDGDLAVHQSAVLVSYFDPDTGPVWRPYQDKATGSLAATAPPQSFGLASPQAKPVALAALSLQTQPNFLFTASWVDLLPSVQQRTRRIATDGTALGSVQDVATPVVDGLRTYAGKYGQILAIGDEADAGIVAWKRSYAAYGDDGKQLGGALQLLDKSDLPLRAHAVYDAEADVWVVAWAGWQKSPGVWFRRFR